MQNLVKEKEIYFDENLIKKLKIQVQLLSFDTLNQILIV